MILGTVTAVDNINGIRVTVDGEDEPTTKKYTYIASYVPSVDDRVIIEEINGSYVILGKIISDFSSSGIVRQADNATNAVNAESAATSAECTGNAATATTAGSCTGNAATATTATNWSGATTQYGGIVTYVQTQYSSAIGGNYVSSISLTNGNFVTHL